MTISTYDAAARRWLIGQPMYDLTITTTGNCGLYQYPPSFLALILPLTLLSPEAATWVWIAASVVCVVLAVALMPVSGPVRLVTLALAGTAGPSCSRSRWAPRVRSCCSCSPPHGDGWTARCGWGWVVAIGALAKLQPGLLLPWMALTGRWRAFLVSGTIEVAVLAAGLVVRPCVVDRLLHRRCEPCPGRPSMLPANFAPASLAMRSFGLSLDAAQSCRARRTRCSSSDWWS